MTDYRVNVPELGRLIDKSAELEKKIEERVAAIEKRIDDLHVDWSGTGAAGHRRAHNERVAAVAEMRAALRTLHDKLRTAHEAYGWVGPANHGMWP
ncbi:type VII secretion system (Wss) protein ESAT-6 [Nocardia tenerifensis]|uniref:Type VII secretion system (Wss) protein ESAT-6 n=1 Tax=Nocardia tenerifensis TaxID=228006 RepID=A0A318JUJ8_9NOCA|nr:WXG100 family type VII secretion target [Nocardia tenerifensis]PXX55602.1 type VII secretion system (Wss) protein ESAT-6 [Nocardia tenerifensis]